METHLNDFVYSAWALSDLLRNLVQLVSVKVIYESTTVDWATMLPRVFGPKVHSIINFGGGGQLTLLISICTDYNIA